MYKKRKLKDFYISIFFILVIFIHSCSSSSNSSNALVSFASGRPGDLLLVMENEDYQSPAGLAIAEVLQASMPSMPQDEPIMTLSFVNPKNLNGNLRTTRNILIANIDSTRFTTTSMKYSYDEWVRGQLLMEINSVSKDSLAYFVKKNAEMITNIIIKHEFWISGDYLAKKYSSEAYNKVDSLFSYYINTSETIKKHKIGENFLWMSNDAVRKRMDLAVYTYPYNSEKDLNYDRVISVRDSVFKKNIQGTDASSYPSTEKIFGLMHRNVFMSDSTKRTEVRGLWKMEGPDMMGGPFVLHAMLDKRVNKVIVVDAFVYHPNENKRDLIRLMEASLYSFRTNDKKVFDPNTILNVKYSLNY